jgi:hypothetical protein
MSDNSLSQASPVVGIETAGAIARLSGDMQSANGSPLAQKGGKNRKSNKGGKSRKSGKSKKVRKTSKARKSKKSRK